MKERGGWTKWTRSASARHRKRREEREEREIGKRGGREEGGRDPTPCTLRSTPYTLHPTPYTLCPTPYTLHPTPYTLHTCPYTPEIGHCDDLVIGMINTGLNEIPPPYGDYIAEGTHSQNVYVLR